MEVYTQCPKEAFTLYQAGGRGQKKRKEVMDKMLFQILVPLLCHSEQLLFHPHQEDNSLFPKRKKKRWGRCQAMGYNTSTYTSSLYLLELSENCFSLILLRQQQKKIAIINQKSINIILALKPEKFRNYSLHQSQLFQNECYWEHQWFYQVFQYWKSRINF